IYNSSDVYSTGIYQKFTEEAQAKNLEIVAAEAFTADSKTDFSVQIQKAKDSGADLVFLPIYYQEASLILTQANKMGYKPTFFGCDGLDGLLAVEGFDTELAEGVMLLTPFTADAEDEKTQTFVKDYEEAFDITPIQFAADAYDCIYAIKEAAEKAEVTPDMSVSDICDAMKTSMTEITIDGLTGSGITWESDGEPSKEAKAVIISDGSYKAM
ncbi:MAG: ABC transporter substrate-binding protein, partial [Blautia hydrogenotrophica]